jgi:hypothetical protein
MAEARPLPFTAATLCTLSGRPGSRELHAARASTESQVYLRGERWAARPAAGVPRAIRQLRRWRARFTSFPTNRALSIHRRNTSVVDAARPGPHAVRRGVQLASLLPEEPQPLSAGAPAGPWGRRRAAERGAAILRAHATTVPHRRRPERREGEGSTARLPPAAGAPARELHGAARDRRQRHCGGAHAPLLHALRQPSRPR